MDDDQKKFILLLAIDAEYFQRAFANPCTMSNQRRSWSGVRFTAQLAIRFVIANYRTVRDGVALKGSHRMGDGRIFSENLRASLFNDDLANEPNFCQIFRSFSLDSTFNLKAVTRNHGILDRLPLCTLLCCVLRRGEADP
jgi:hypothetical protein